ncbi:MAG: hypothetical protein Q4Q07_00090 [Tissierellia bacterium]|nr:hypothetical protein [Tissierellia bacterium]
MDSQILKSMPLHLHTEVYEDYLSDEGIRFLRRYGEGTKEGCLTRDFLIPEDMTLQSIHAMIQKAYGWENTHLHLFELDKEDFEILTEDCIENWEELVGEVFPFPGIFKDFLLDVEGRSLEKSFTGPYNKKPIIPKEEHKKSLENFFEKVKEIPVFNEKKKEWENTPLEKASLKELQASRIFEGSMNELLEHLEIRDVLYFEDEKVEKDESFPLGKGLIYCYDFGDHWTVKISLRKSWEHLLKEGLITGEELAKAERIVAKEHRPICLHRQGVNLFDDVGGLEGFARFLQEVYEGETLEAREELLEYGKNMGWSKEKISPYDTLS